MDKEEYLFALTLTQMILEYGVPAVIQAIQTWEIDEPTVEDIRALKITKKPEDYFAE